MEIGDDTYRVIKFRRFLNGEPKIKNLVLIISFSYFLLVDMS